METARQVASYPVVSTPVPYDQMKSQCEALVTGKQQKMSVLQSFKTQQEVKALVVSSEYNQNDPPLPITVSLYILLIQALIIFNIYVLLLCVYVFFFFLWLPAKSSINHHPSDFDKNVLIAVASWTFLGL